MRVRVDGQLACNNVPMITRAAVAGFGLAFTIENQVQEHLASGRLIRVMEDWCPPFAGYHLHYPSRREPSAALHHWWRLCAIVANQGLLQGQWLTT